MRKLKQKILLAVLALTILNPTLVMAQTNTGTVTEYKGVEGSLTEYLCTPTDNDNGRALEQCVNKLYRFGIAFGAIALVFFVVFAGYMYMAGGETGKGKAKGILQNALVGMGILLFSYVLLRFINPNLVIYKAIQPPIFTAPDIASCASVGLGQDCVLPGGGIAVSDGSGGGKAYASCPGGTLVNVTGVRTDGSVGKICKALMDKLTALKAATPNIPWLVSSTVDGRHLSNCHKPGSSVTGVCADLAMDGGRLPTYSRDAGSTNPKWGELCGAVNALGGVSIANEAFSGSPCPAYKAYPTTTGPNLHIFLSN
jgi:hypothetical protein